MTSAEIMHRLSPRHAEHRDDVLHEQNVPCECWVIHWLVKKYKHAGREFGAKQVTSERKITLSHAYWSFRTALTEIDYYLGEGGLRMSVGANGERRGSSSQVKAPSSAIQQPASVRPQSLASQTQPWPGGTRDQGTIGNYGWHS